MANSNKPEWFDAWSDDNWPWLQFYKDAGNFLSSLEECFSRAGVLRCDADAAAARFIADPEGPTFPREILLYLVRSANISKGNRVTRELNDPAIRAVANKSGYRCRICSDSFMVVVPHIADCHGGQWCPGKNGCFYTMAVRCSCAPPERVADERHRMRTLNDYERWVPDWKEQMAKRTELLLAEASAGSGGALGSLRAVMAKLLARGTE